MNKKVTIHDIARELGIASSTVSRALNGNTRISVKTRNLISEKALEMGYRPNKLASALRTGESRTIGIIVPFADRAFFGSVIGAIEETVHEYGYQLILCQSNDIWENEEKKIDLLLKTQVSGILVSTSPNVGEPAHLQRVLDANIPLIMFDRVDDRIKTSTVKVNDFQGAYDMVKHLIDQGCTKIAHLAGDLRLAIYFDRFQGYKQALHDYGLSFDPKMIRQRDCFVDLGYEATEELFNEGYRPDGIFASSDHKAVGAVKYLIGKGYKIPGQIAVSGFSNEPITEHMIPPVSTVDQRTKEMGRRAAEFFLWSMENPGKKGFQEALLQPQLIIRQSSLKSAVPQSELAS